MAAASAATNTMDSGKAVENAAGNSSRRLKTKEPAVSFRALFRYITRAELALNVIAYVFSAANGIVMPCYALLFGSMLNAFNNPSVDLMTAVNTIALYFFLLAIGGAFATFISIALPTITAENQACRVRNSYVRSLLRQDLSFYDANKAGELSARLTEDSISMLAGLGHPVAQAIQYLSAFIAGIVVGFISSWQLTLLIFASVPLMVIIMGFLRRFMSSLESRIAKAYAKAGDAANETFANIRTVLAYGGGENEVARYDAHLLAAMKSGEKSGWFLGAALGSFFAIMYIMYGFACTLSAVLIIDSRSAHPECLLNPTLSVCFTGANVVQTLMAVLIGALMLGQVGPAIATVTTAQVAARKLYDVIDRVPLIDPYSTDGAKPDPAALKGTIEFRGVTFAYPTRPTEIILRNFSLVIDGGSHVALVGESGSGKSTLVLLVQRFYDPLEGSILVDGIDVRNWNLRHLRDRIGVVSQEPTLFAASVAENIGHGRPDSLPTPTRSEIEAAAKAANADDFIVRLPLGYDSLVGTSVSTTQLSGGQRQRLCIARAILRAPALLLLDEATSALDTASERLVQSALDRMVSGRTSLTIAHRLSTVTHADRIVVMSRGSIIEDGTHADLIAREDGVYRRLRLLQDTARSDGGHVTVDESSAAQVFGAASQETSQSIEASTAAATPDHVSISLPIASSETTSKESGHRVAKAVAPTDFSNVAESKDPEKDAALTALKDNLPPVPLLRVWNEQRPEAWYLAVGLIASCAAGGFTPIFSIVWSDMIADFYNPDNEFLRHSSLVYLGYFAAIATGQYLATVLRIGAFVLAGERLTRRLRTKAYRSVVRQSLEFFDAPVNAVGRLSSRLATDAAEVKGATGQGLAAVVQAGASVIAGMIIAFAANWRLALVLLAALPLFLLSTYIQGRAWHATDAGTNKALEEAAHVAVEATSAIRTVAAFNLQNRMLASFSVCMEVPRKTGARKALVSATGQGFATLVTMSLQALAFYVGAIFISQGNMTFAQLIRIFMAITMATQGAGQAMSRAPSAMRAQRAMRSVFHLIDLKPTIDSSSTEGKVPSDSAGNEDVPLPGAIVFENVRFAYPARPQDPVLRGLSLTIKPGQKVALVGPSGCGKSTVIQLLERFYDPAAGRITLAGEPLASYSLKWLRRRMGFISQEPVLFADSVSYNVQYGCSDDSAPTWDAGVPMDTPADFVATLEQTAAPEGVVAACQAANAAEFIEGFRFRYGTHCGGKGSQLSGGQRQRIAIARAILRHPRLVLCDEATAALDSESERRVQAALDAMLQGPAAGAKSVPGDTIAPTEATSHAASSSEDGQSAAVTSLVIAHRLSTIRDADVIYVMDRGVVVECGTHNQLMALHPPAGGLYRSLAVAQGIVDVEAATGSARPPSPTSGSVALAAVTQPALAAQS